MMDSMIQSLDARLSKARIAAMAHNLRHDECGIESMLAMMSQTSNRRRAYNAAWILTYLSEEDKRRYLLPRYAELVRIATFETLCFRRALVLSVLADLPAGDEPNAGLLDYCLTHLTDMKESNGTRAVMIKLAAKLCKPYPELCRELELCLDTLPQDMPQSIAAAKRNALKMISLKQLMED